MFSFHLRHVDYVPQILSNHLIFLYEFLNNCCTIEVEHAAMSALLHVYANMCTCLQIDLNYFFICF